MIDLRALVIWLLVVGGWAAAAAAEGEGGGATGVSCALPVVVRSALRDIHESWLNGPEGYAFITELGSEKTGNVPVEVGRDPVRRFDTAVYASNFQGPLLVRRPGLRPQWEWTADGASEVSEREYPLLAARACTSSAAALPAITLHVAEHDEWPWINDAVGAFTLDLARCQDVLTTTRRSGWTPRQRSAGVGDDDSSDVEFVDYLLWCYHCDGGSDCEDGITWDSPQSP